MGLGFLATSIRVVKSQKITRFFGRKIIIIKIIIISNPDKDVASFYGNPVLSTF